ncbi:MAG: aminopeptidase [Vicingaceae bacterium]|nr:MAG: aminopeptidase [Vicingaceae bacterium]
MKKPFLFFISLFLVYISLDAQQIDYGRKWVDTLSSIHFSGRGPAFEGEKKALDYIADEMKNIGLKPLGYSYIQSFTYPCVWIKDSISLVIDGTPLTAGIDFLPDAASGSISGTFDLIHYSLKNLPGYNTIKKLSKKGFYKDKIVVIEDYTVEERKNYGPKTLKAFQLIEDNQIGAAGLMIKKNRPIYSKSIEKLSYGKIEVDKNKVHTGMRQAKINIHSQLVENPSGNAIGWIKGTEVPDSFIVFTAHYDHLGMAGQLLFPGANDNASGTAMILSLAKYFAAHPERYSLVFIAFGGEEAGLIGSYYFVQNPLIPLNRIKFLVNFDILGTGDEGITVVNATIHDKEFNLLDSINAKYNYVPAIKKRGKAPISDHHFFTEKGVPSFYIYTLGGIKAYHDIFDRSETLPLTEFDDIFQLMVKYTTAICR